MNQIKELLEIKVPRFIRNSSGLDWPRMINEKPIFGGVYVFWWNGAAKTFFETLGNRQLHFHGPGGKRNVWNISMDDLHTASNDRLPLYVGKTSSYISKRVGLHLKLRTDRTVPSKAVNFTGNRKTTSCQVRDRLDRLFPNRDTREIALKNLSLSYQKLHGPEHFDKRFFLENLAIGLLKPIFNVDSER